MYKILKDEGYNKVVTIENAETKASLIIGKVTIEMLNVLDTAGYKVGDKGLTITNKWDLNIDKATADTLSKMAMKMKKPIRDQRKKTANEINRKMYNKEIDAMDVLLGLASYN